MSHIYEETVLSTMKRSELQKLAKKHGIKANMKTDDLIKALAAVADTSAEALVASPSKRKSGPPAIFTSSSSTEDQSESEVTEEKKPRSRQGRWRKQVASKGKSGKETPQKSPSAKRAAQIVTVTATPSSTSEDDTTDAQISSATEDEKVSPVAKKAKAKAKGRGRGKGRRGKKTVEDEAPKAEAVGAAVASPAVGGRRSRSRQATPVAAIPVAPSPALLTPPNSGSSRRIQKAIRRTTHTPTVPAPQKTPKVPTPAPSSAGKRSSSRSSSSKTAPKTVTPVMPPASTKSSSGGKRSASGSAGGKTKKVRRGTFDKSPAKVEKSPAPKEIKKTASSESLKDQIMAEIDRKVQLQVASSKKSAATAAKPAQKTPGKRNWTKSHHGAFDKMESIDDYLARKRKRAEALSSTKKPKIPVRVKSTAKPKGFNFASPKPGASNKPQKTFSFASPKPTAATKPASAAKSAKTVSFRVSKLKTPKKPVLPPSQLAAGAAAGKVEKRQATPGARKSVSALTPAASATTARKSVGGRGGTTPGRERKSLAGAERKSLAGGDRKSLSGRDRKSLGATKTPSRKSFGGPMTPFAQTSANTPGHLKNSFNLKASLAKPLAYKPHTGKLKPFGETQHNEANAAPATAKPASSNLVKAKAMVKRPHLKGRDARRAVSAKHRAQKRDDSFMARRGGW